MFMSVIGSVWPVLNHSILTLSRPSMLPFGRPRLMRMRRFARLWIHELRYKPEMQYAVFASTHQQRSRRIRFQLRCRFVMGVPAMYQHSTCELPDVELP